MPGFLGPAFFCSFIPLKLFINSGMNENFSEPVNSQHPVGVSLINGHVRWGQSVLFDNLDMQLEAGKFTCLLGPSGVGKSMLLRLFLGLGAGHPDNKADVICSDGLGLQGRAAFMAQNDLLMPWLTVAENVGLGLILRSGRKNLKTQKLSIDQLLDDVGLNAVRDVRPDTLSGGMRQRVAIARTLFENKPVVLMDEPFSALDVITRLKLQDMAARTLFGRTVLLVTHDPMEALRLGHRIYVMSGSPAELDAGLLPPGDIPRHVDDGQLLSMQGELLARLAGAPS